MKSLPLIVASVIAGMNFASISTNQIRLTDPSGSTAAFVESWGDGSEGFVILDGRGRKRLGVTFHPEGPPSYVVLGPGVGNHADSAFLGAKQASGGSGFGVELVSKSNTGKIHFEGCRWFDEDKALQIDLSGVDSGSFCKVCSRGK